MNRLTTLRFAATFAILGIPALASAQELNRTRIPEAQPVPVMTLPNIQKTTLTNGLAVWLVEQRELPVVAMNLIIQSGSDHDPVSQPGLASMTAEVLDEGTTTRTSLEIAEELEFIGASMNVSSSVDGTFIRLNTLTKHLDKALVVFADVVMNANFPAHEFSRLQKQQQTSLLQQKDRPATIASLVFNHILYGPSHPYGNDPSGTEESITAMTRDDLVRFYTANYRPNNATLIVVGAVTLKDITHKLNEHLSGWKEVPLVRPALPPVPPLQTRKVYLIDKPDAPQSQIRIGFPALARNTPDYFPVMVLNRILGGQFSSRVNMNLRERRGFTYGARTVFAFYKQPGPFVASAGVTTAKTDSSIQEFLYEMNRMHREGITPEELSYSKKGLTGSFALSFETVGQIANNLQNIALYGLANNYYNTYLQNIDRVTLEDVREASQRYLDTSGMAVVVVGDLKTIQKSIETMNLGETVVCDVRGKPLTE